MRRSLMTIIAITVSVFLCGCSSTKKVDDFKAEGKDITLTMAVFSNNDKEYFSEINNIEIAYSKVEPNVKIQLDIYKDVTEFENAMRIRRTADELPDIIPLKGYMIEDFKDVLAPLDELEAVKNNIYAKDFLVDNKVLGIPQLAFHEFVFYNKEVFEKYDLDIPSTWGEFLEIVNIINNNGEYIPIAMAGKDVWPVYPFNSYMPFLISNDGAVYDTMGGQMDAFKKNNPFYIANAQVKELYDINPFGENVLEIGWNEAKTMFISKETAMIAAGQWFLPESIAAGAIEDDLGVFLLPVRREKDEVFRTVTVVDLFMATLKDGHNLEESKKFINWFFCSDYYREYIEYMKQFSTIEGVESGIPMISDVLNNENLEFVLIKNEGLLARTLEKSINFNPKDVGQDMLRGKTVDEIMESLDENWEKYKKNTESR